MVELLLVMAIIGTLAIMAISGFDKVRNQARSSRAAGEIRGLETEINAYAVDKGAYPLSLADVGRANAKDPWERDYVYKPFTATQMRYDAGINDLNSDFDLYSLGFDGLTDLSITHANSQDDIVRAENGGYVGLARKL